MSMKSKLFGLGLLRQVKKNRNFLYEAVIAAAANDKIAESALLSDGTVPHDTVCVNDTSGSMAWKDCKPSRLEAGKMAVGKFIARRASLSSTDRIALVSFDSEARVVLPFTAISNRTLIHSAVTGLNAKGGTDIANGLRAAAGIFAVEPMAYFAAHRLKRVLLLTDGCGGNPLKASMALKDAGVLIEVIGIGGDRTAVNENLLRRVATTDANGFTHYWFVSDTGDLIKQYENMAAGIVWKGRSK